MLLETLVVFCLCSVLLLGIVYGYGSCLRAQQRIQEAYQAYLLAQRFAAGEVVELQTGWQLVTHQEKLKNVLLTNIQVKIGERVVANVVQAHE